MGTTPQGKASLKEIVRRMKESADENYTQQEFSTVVSAGLEDLHGSVLPMTLISLLYGLTILVQIFALPIIPVPVADAYRVWGTYETVLPPGLGMLVFGYMIYAYLHNLKRWAFTFHTIIVGFWTFLMTLLWFWLWAERFWYCPNETPIWCTNGITSEIALGYEIFLWVTIIQVPLLWIELFIYASANRYWRVLYRATSFTGSNLASIVYNNPAFQDRFLITIGDEQRDEGVDLLPEAAGLRARNNKRE